MEMPEALPVGGRPSVEPWLSTPRNTSSALNLCDSVAVLLLILGVLIVALTFSDYGITWDEEWQATYGKLLWQFYASGFRDTSAMHYRDLYLYGGLFDLVSAGLIRVSPFGEYETRHLLGGLIGVLGMAGTWMLARHLRGPRTGLIALCLLATTPLYYGHMFFNPKDIPFACGMVWSLYWMLRLLETFPQRPRIKHACVFGAISGLTMGTRVGALLLYVYLAIALIMLALAHVHGHRGKHTDTLRFTGGLLPALPIAYGVTALTWPWSAASWLNPLRALFTFAHFGWSGQTLIDGQKVPTLYLPRYYQLLFFSIQLPELVLLGLVAALSMGLSHIYRQRQWPATGLGLVILAVLFPIAYFILARPESYHTVRHYLFMIPPICVLASIGFDRCLEASQHFSKQLAYVLTLTWCVGLAMQIERMWALHPNEYIYYNMLVGGVRGAEGRFELDYWGNSLAEAAHDLTRMVEQEDAQTAIHRLSTVAVGGHLLSASYFLPTRFKVIRDLHHADFIISLTLMKMDVGMPGVIVAKVVRDDVVLAVVKDCRSVKPRSLQQNKLSD